MTLIKIAKFVELSIDGITYDRISDDLLDHGWEISEEWKDIDESGETALFELGYLTIIVPFSIGEISAHDKKASFLSGAIEMAAIHEGVDEFTIYRRWGGELSDEQVTAIEAFNKAFHV